MIRNLSAHPKALPVLFLTEMWERFSYYGMRALLVLYAVKFLGFSDQLAGQLYGAYTGLVYLTPLLGGWIADRYLGFRRSILLGGILMGIGHISLAIHGIEFFYIGLFFLIIGNGFFKPNMSSLVGLLYKENPNMRDSGYTIFYMGINLGGFFGPIICGSLGEKMEWHYGFGAAGIGMAIGVITFYFGQSLLPKSIGHMPRKNSNSNQSYVPGIILEAGFPFLRNFKKKKFNNKEAKEIKVEIMDSENFLKENSNHLTKSEWNSIKAIGVLSFFSIFFWSAFEQAGSSMNLFADRYVDRMIGSYEIPASVFQSVNPIFILLLAPLFAKLWIVLGKKNWEPDKPMKFSLGLLLLSIGFVFLVLGAREVANSGISGMGYLLLAYLFNTLGELCLSPVGLSMVSELAPKSLSGLMMGMWFLSNAIAHYAGGVFSGMMSEWQLNVFFSFFVGMSLLACIILLLIRPKLKNWISD
jgi:POT family proton-dependent oligopeptide transporter